MLLLRAREAVMRHFRASLRRHDLTEQQWRVLRALADVDEIEITDLARATLLHGPSLTRILRDLEARKLVARRTSTRDQRKSLISISSAGATTIARVAPHSEAIYDEITRRIGRTELQRIEATLITLERALADGAPIGDVVYD